MRLIQKKKMSKSHWTPQQLFNKGLDKVPNFGGLHMYALGVSGHSFFFWEEAITLIDFA